MRAAWAGWAALFVVVATLILSGSKRSVVDDYLRGAQAWLSSEPVYHKGGYGFVYPPQSAVAFVPFALLPDRACEVVWRLLTIGVFAFGVYRLARLADPRRSPAMFPLVTLVAIVMSFDAARNGQATLLITGLMMIAVGDVARERWWRAVVWLSIAMVIKPLAIVLVLLVAALSRPMSWRLTLAVLGVAILPFLTQRPMYVMEQFAGFGEKMQAVTAEAHEKSFADVFGMLQVWGVDAPDMVRIATRGIAALAVLLMAWVVRGRATPRHTAATLFVLTAYYLMLFSPRTELNTYAMLGPALGVCIAARVRQGRGWFVTAALAIAAVAIALSYEINKLSPWDSAAWLPPLVTLLTFAAVSPQLLARCAEPVAPPPDAAAGSDESSVAETTDSLQSG